MRTGGRNTMNAVITLYKISHMSFAVGAYGKKTAG